jgi:glycerol uptake facilitator-like aquaporin
MVEYNLPRRASAEFLGTAFLLAVIVGSGIMGERLAGGNVAVALLANALATGAGLLALILTFGPVSGAHFNPVVTLMSAVNRDFRWSDTPAYLLAQFTGAIAGVWAAHMMFGLAAFSFSQHERSGLSQAFSEFVATFGLLAVIACGSRHRPSAVPLGVAAYVAAGYWFTASTALANPAVTLARSLTDTFSGIRPVDTPAFIAAQILATITACAVLGWMLAPHKSAMAEGARTEWLPNRETSSAGNRP